jgi:polyhydroxyalkanoate synthesis repressor PhaR
MTEKDTIYYKKYSNRRLYDVAFKRYVTFKDISAKIREGYKVVITDNDNKEDITVQVLTQIVLQEGQGFFSSELLHQLIKLTPYYYMKGYLEEYLKMGIQSYMESIKRFNERYKSLVNIGLPINNEKASEASIEMFRHFFEKLTHKK